MFKNKSIQGKNNISGARIRELRKTMPTKMSQRMLAEQLQLLGLDVDKNAIQRIECGKRFVTDIELVAFSKVFNVSCDELISDIKSSDTSLNL